MTFAEQLKQLRKNAGLSQEKLAEKLGVSRQAVTKWETDTGTPDIENLMAVSALFGVSIDELLSGEKPQTKSNDFLFESITEYDIDRPKRYDMNFGGAKRICVSGCSGEKVKVRLASNQISTLQNDFKLKLDDGRDHIDMDMSRKNGMTEGTAKESLIIFVSLPAKYMRRIELNANAGTIELRTLDCEQIELDVKTADLHIDEVAGAVEVNCSLDMNIECSGLQGALELNQVSATSKVTVPQGYPFRTVVKGIGNSVLYQKDGNLCEDFSSSADNVIMLNGMKSELVISEAGNEA